MATIGGAAGAGNPSNEGNRALKIPELGGFRAGSDRGDTGCVSPATEPPGQSNDTEEVHR